MKKIAGIAANPCIWHSHLFPAEGLPRRLTKCCGAGGKHGGGNSGSGSPDGSGFGNHGGGKPSGRRRQYKH